MEHIPSGQTSIEYTKELLHMKMEVQRAVIEYFCEGDIHNTQKVEAWIQEFSSSFREIFERKVRDDKSFIERIRFHKDEVVQEIIQELEKDGANATT